MKKKYSLIVMDEIFNSTNPLEAVAGAYAVCKKMASYTNNILIFTTHYNYLTKLAKDKTYRFANYKMETIVNFDNIQFTYKLQRGVNKHLLALELLKRNGFDNDVIEEAIAIKNMLQKQ
jgi:DNA mismatch repair ATPase MutS